MKLSETGIEDISNLSSVDLEYEEFEACEFTGELTMSWMGFEAQKHGMDIVVGSSYSDLKVKIHNIPFDAIKRFAFELSMAVIQAEDRIKQAEMSKQSTQCENVSKKDEKIITLTLEEAKDFLGWLHNSQWKHRTDLEYAEDWQRDWIRYLKERIEQAEGKR